MRKIIHIDMDAFFASVEQRDFPELRGKPVAVGGSGPRGVVAAASYEARKFGVFSAMPGSVARRKCPELIFVKTRFEVYEKVSRQIREIFHLYTDLVEPLSLDEAYLDVTENHFQLASATRIAREIKDRIKAETGLTASAGVSCNKFLAKVASAYRKPDGLTVVLPENAAALVETLPIEKFYGIGAVTAARMHSLGIRTGLDLKQLPAEELRKHFGKAGEYYYQIARAQDDRPVEPNRIRKSVGAERTFAEDLTTAGEMEEQLLPLAREVAEYLQNRNNAGRTITLKIKHNDFSQTTRSKTFLSAIQTPDLLFRLAKELLHTPGLPALPVRLLGVSVSGLQSELNARYGCQLYLPFSGGNAPSVLPAPDLETT
ncbi:MAG TPA: DNA polymerase IV [Adhaeribacter sp.]|nr:DNA polymerase IV [Adhaeribacter sp.]